MNIYEKLCYDDKRNPYFQDDGDHGEVVKRPNCHCDNCFYGRTALAEKIIDLTEQVERLEWDNRDRL